MTKGEAAALVTIISMGWPRPEMKDGTRDFYEQHLLDLDLELAKKAVARLAASAKFLPSVSEIREAATSLEVGARRQGMEAWADVVEAIRRHGVYRPLQLPEGRPWPPPFVDPVVAECVRQMGWRALCLSENDMADRARFVELYNTLAERARADTVAGPGLALPSPPHGRLSGAAQANALLAGIGNGGKRA